MKAPEGVLVVASVLLLFGLPLEKTGTLTAGPWQDITAEQELSGIVSDSTCKGWHNRKAVTNYSCTRQCVADGADYALVVGRTVYILEGHKAELDKFAGGRATITGEVDGNRVLIDSVAAKKKKADTPTVANLFTLQTKQQPPQPKPKGNPEYLDLQNEILRLKAEVEDLEKRLLPASEHPSTVQPKPLPEAGPTSSEQIGDLEREVKELQSRIDRLKHVMDRMRSQSVRPD